MDEGTIIDEGLEPVIPPELFVDIAEKLKRGSVTLLNLALMSKATYVLLLSTLIETLDLRRVREDIMDFHLQSGHFRFDYVKRLSARPFLLRTPASLLSDSAKAALPSDGLALLTGTPANGKQSPLSGQYYGG